jgi:hypothetical protein
MQNSLLQQFNNTDLGAMINHIEAQREKKISSEAADILIHAIQYIINNN